MTDRTLGCNFTALGSKSTGSSQKPELDKQAEKEDLQRGRRLVFWAKASVLKKRVKNLSEIPSQYEQGVSNMYEISEAGDALGVSDAGLLLILDARVRESQESVWAA
ncbi:hypothetical protein DFH09DRAFT_1084249 [Mycena vulgaris]|nr:hypothetical protein DFH09DRAFT_1084249 [Mycena vulgaris]